MESSVKIINKLKEYFAKRDDVLLAYLFGSQATGNASNIRSDYDIAVYFKPKTGVFEYEESEWGKISYLYEAETPIQDDIIHITGKEVDLVVLNRAPAYLTAGILKTGIVLKEADRKIFLELWLRSLSDAEDYRVFFADYWEIMKRSNSLSQIDRDRLIKILPFLKAELNLLREYGAIDQLIYMEVDIKRKALERNIENIVNAGLDIAKILLASNYIPVPDKYAEIMATLLKLKGFDAEVAKKLSESAKLRNFIAHEYLDYRWVRIKSFIDGAQENFNYLISFTEKNLSR